MQHILDSHSRLLRRKGLRLGMLHYHLKSGGVVSAMRDIVQALARCARYESTHCTIFAAVDCSERASSIFELSTPEVPSGKIIDVPGLAYRAEPYRDRPSFMQAAEDLAVSIVQRIENEDGKGASPFILHAHNISLGKNPTATMAFLRIARIAAERSLPLWLINHVHDFAENNRPDQMKAFFTCTGRTDPAFARSFMYPNGPNILYLTINSSDIDNLRTLGIPPHRIFLLPDPIDVERLGQEPIWEEAEWRAEGLPPADYRRVLIDRLGEFADSTSQLFDCSLPILLSPMKVMRRKNSLEALLLTMLFQRLGRRFQLLISLDANSPPDVEYSAQMKRFARENELSLLVGFGHRLLSDGGTRLIRDNVPHVFNLSDAIALSEAVLTTSVVEGFGFVYHEGWLCRRPVIGRKIPEVVADFERNGMDFGHMYERLAVSLSDLPNLKQRLYEAFDRRLLSQAREPWQLTNVSAKDIMNTKVFAAGREECIDFADLDVRMQLELLARCRESTAISDRLISRNPVVPAMFKLIENCPTRLIEKNQDAVRKHYSLEAMARRLEHLFEIGDAIYTEKITPVTPRPEDHSAVIAKYHAPDKTRLLLTAKPPSETKGEET